MVCSFYCRTFSRIALSQSPSRAARGMVHGARFVCENEYDKTFEAPLETIVRYLPQRRDARQKSRLFARRN